ncbi:hypothetical protein [Bacillus sinesaloumensis]|uniref:hypothetical protein n=1 Tax=Litchfieldia sinesaloumensis TaxID=1926280 RepID=UPI0009884385|nr:hypothetical protein [Bacillus sinesaloumensis]
MDKRTQEIIDFTREKFGLWDYYLERHSFDRTVTIFNETVYTMTMEWFPNEAKDQVIEDENPDGTAVITLDIHSNRFESVIFVMGQTFAKDGVTFKDKNDSMKWIEKETGLTYGQQFELHKEEEGELHFRECIEGVALSPSGLIEVKYDPEGRLTLFTVHGHYPAHDMVKKEPYSLTFNRIEDIAKHQLKLLEFPNFDEKRLVSAYAIEEVYVRNDKLSTIPFEVIVDVRGYLKIDQPLYWNQPLTASVERKQIKWRDEVTAEQAFSGEPSPDSVPITEAEQEQIIHGVRDFLRKEYPNESGIWILKSLHRESGYIHAILRASKQDKRVFQRKINVIMDPESLQVVNYMDNQMMLEMFDNFKASEAKTISREEAYERLKEHFELSPYYVYDFEQKQYVLCGKIDCQFAVHATTGEIVSLDEL